MTLGKLFSNIRPYVRPYKWLVVATEQIKNSIDAIKQNRTVIIISHSISQIIDSEMINALQNGCVMQSGNPDDVYKQGGVYKEIFDASARSLNIEKIANTIEG